MRKLIKTYEYGHVPNTYDIFKAVALLTMVIDHVGYYLFPEIGWFRVMGRIAFPIFLFLIGYSRTYRFDSWLIAGGVVVLLGAGFSGFPVLPLNILFAIAVSRVAMQWLEKRPHIMNDLLMLWVVLLVFYIPTTLLMEYGTLGLMFAVLGWYVREGRDDFALRLTWLATAVIWVALQSLTFGFTMPQVSLLIAETVLLALAMMQFVQRNHPLPPKHISPSPTWMERVVILSGRNTLLLYVLHVVALQAAAKFLYPERHSQFFMLMQW